MRIAKLLISLAITAGLIVVLDNRWVVGGSGIPPLGRFLDPFHGFWNNMESRAFRPAGDVVIPGLKDEVTIVFDDMLVPHIFAASEDDLYFAQGYITAYHRLWQMEFQTHAAAGRISELIESDAALNYDRKQRRLGMVYGAEKATEAMLADKAVAAAVRRYTDGVNAYINTLSYADLPFEYKLLDYRPEPWTPLKMGLLLKNLSQTLNISERDLEMTNALALFGKETSELLYAENDVPVGDPIVDNPGGWDFAPVRFDTVPLAIPDQLVKIATPKDKKRGIGSNNWAVAGSKTANGAPILCNDPHLTLSYPSIWYVVHLHAPTVNTMGASLPGSPLVILGFNDSIAWGCTNAQRDLADWYRIRFRDSTYNEYLSDGQWKKTSRKVEVFRVRGREPFYDTVIYTHHGPVVYDRTFHGDHEKNHYAFRWIAHDGSNELRAVYDLNHGRDYDDYESALRHWAGPAQNFVFASVQGDIAMRVSGRFPVRRKDEGKYVLDGTNTTNEWQAFIPFEHTIQSKNPKRGFVSSANQFPADATYPYYLHSDWYETYRNRRINEVLSAQGGLRATDMMALQNDNYNLQASESLPLMLSLLDVSTLNGDERRIAEALMYWDFMNSRESLSASYYEAWWVRLKELLWDEFTTAKVSLDIPDNHATIRLMKTQQALPFYDRVDTPQKESLQDLVRLAFTESLSSVAKWEARHNKAPEWADFKDTYIQHLLMLAPLSTHVRVAGYEGIVNAADQRTGPSWRFIVSLERPVKAWGIYPGGQSGNPGSFYYDNFVAKWSDGNYYPLEFSPSLEKTKEAAYAVMQLKP